MATGLGWSTELRGHTESTLSMWGWCVCGGGRCWQPWGWRAHSHTAGCQEVRVWLVVRLRTLSHASAQLRAGHDCAQELACGSVCRLGLQSTMQGTHMSCCALVSACTPVYGHFAVCLDALLVCGRTCTCQGAPCLFAVSGCNRCSPAGVATRSKELLDVHRAVLLSLCNGVNATMLPGGWLSAD
jgi:hypothetical protein